MKNSKNEDALFLRLPSAARLIDTTPGALRKRLERTELPPGVVIRKGRTIWVHRERFLKWMEEDSFWARKSA